MGDFWRSIALERGSCRKGKSTVFFSPIQIPVSTCLSLSLSLCPFISSSSATWDQVYLHSILWFRPPWLLYSTNLADLSKNHAPQTEKPPDSTLLQRTTPDRYRQSTGSHRLDWWSQDGSYIFLSFFHVTSKTWSLPFFQKILGIRSSRSTILKNGDPLYHP